MNPSPHPITFNSALEAGIRATILLGVAHPNAFDLQRIVAFDYLLVHTGDVGGPSSLHPFAPMQSAELLVRRELVRTALLLMMTRHLVERQPSSTGFLYQAGENAAPFLVNTESRYLAALKERAIWLTTGFGHLSEEELRTTMRGYFENWIEEFHSAEQSLGVTG